MRRATELMMTAEWIDSERAVETGIATRGFPDDQLHERTMEKAREIAQWPVNSLRETKRTLRAGHRAGIENALEIESEAMLRQAGSPENIEAIKAFIEKRPPNFRGIGS
jgi:enoyl-CoA hydratase/carnithine racemase